MRPTQNVLEPTLGRRALAVTIRDIAKRVGKSITTVSRALHDYDDVSPRTKELVRQAAQEMGYTPNILAQRLRKQRSDSIGFIIPTFGPRFSDPFFSEFLAGIGNRAAASGYDLLVSTRAPGEQEMFAFRSNVRGKRVDGFIIVRTRQQDARIAYLLEAGYPFVAFGRTRDGLDFPYVDEDSTHGMFLAVEHLIRLGHRRIACIASPEEYTFSGYRLEGFRQALREAGLQPEETYLRRGDLTEGAGRRQASQLLDLPIRPTAIAACNDLMALGAIAAIRERGLNVGTDIAVTGFDDIPIAEHSYPPLTTVHQPIYQIGSMVCEMLIKLIRGESLDNKQVLLKPKLIVRDSCGSTSRQHSTPPERR